jgi:hypothetical protein
MRGSEHQHYDEDSRDEIDEGQQVEIVRMVQKGGKTAADAARLFNIHPATVCRLIARKAVGAT